MSEHPPFTLRLEASVLEALRHQAAEAGMEAHDYVHAILRRHVVAHGALATGERRRLVLQDQIQQRAIAEARAQEAAGHFDAHFVLTVYRALIADPGFRALYEEAIGGDAYATGLPEKSALNMYLGWTIKTAVEAEPLLDARGRSRRANVRGEVIQSYMLLGRG